MKILVIEDDIVIAGFIKNGLESELCVVDVAITGEHGITLSHINTYDVIILDFDLPDTIGIDISNRIRKKKPSIPILALSIETDIDIKVETLSVCDDYMTKPFSLRELIARLKALTRRGEVLHGTILEINGLVLDSRKYTVMLDGKPIQLRNKEFALLEYFMRNKDVVLSREMMLEYVWDMNTDPFTNTVDTHIRLLRKKLESEQRLFIHTVPKRGYRFGTIN